MRLPNEVSGERAEGGLTRTPAATGLAENDRKDLQEVHREVKMRYRLYALFLSPLFVWLYFTGGLGRVALIAAFVVLMLVPNFIKHYSVVRRLRSLNEDSGGDPAEHEGQEQG